MSAERERERERVSVARKNEIELVREARLAAERERAKSVAREN